VNTLGDCNDCIVCRCEDVKLSQIRQAIHDNGAVSPQEIKMLTRAGMGMCGGRVCGQIVGRVVAAETGIALEDLVWTRSRPPVRPTLMEEVADPSVDAIFAQSKAQSSTPPWMLHKETSANTLAATSELHVDALSPAQEEG